MPIYEFDYLYIIENDIVGLGDDMTEILESTGDVVTNKQQCVGNIKLKIKYILKNDDSLLGIKCE